MSRVKIKSGLASLIIVASMFAGWQTLLIVCALMLLFCEIEDSVKNVMVKVITFTAGVALFSLAWGLIVDGIELITKSLTDLIGVINGYLEYDSKINISKFENYLLNPVNSLASIADNIVNYLITFVRFGFIFGILTGKLQKPNFISNKINEFIDKFTNYTNNADSDNNNSNVNNQYNTNQNM